ncbi:MAG TPA: BTAD domain-containing putative transcriptional regulator, partial [Gammaproteobacteria bacterium]|nr:BTAD domain-containing putative transcriptional regulator [Gammaproteobacteria bacterium]
MADLTLRLLGGLQAHRRGQPVTALTALKARALLAYLAVEHHRAHSRTQLGELLWPDRELQATRNSLRQAIFQLRRALEPSDGPELFLADRDTLRWNPELDLWLDLDAFRFAAGEGSAHEIPPTEELRALERRAALYRGPFLAGFTVPAGLEGFQEWLEEQREHMHRMALRLYGGLARACRERGELTAALEHGQRCIDLDPRMEEGHRLVMGILAARGESNAALRQYDRCREILRTELGTRPEQATEELRDRILDGRVVAGWEQGGLAEGGETTLAAERRQVTILACDYRPPGAPDPEERVHWLGRMLEQASRHIRERGGHILRSHGGSLLAYFGFPAAREKASRDALEAALTLTADPEAADAVRIGVHSETLITGKDPEVPDPAGLATERALEVRDRAPQGTVATTAQVRDLARDGYELEPLAEGLFRLEGRIDPPAEEVGRKQPPPFVGREQELEELLAHAKEARRRGQRGVLVRGEAGVGKTRLIQCFRRRLAARGEFLVREFRCRREIRAVPFGPMLEDLTRRIRVDGKEGPAAKRRRLKAYLEELGIRDPDGYRILTRVLGIAEEQRTSRDPDPRQERVRT